MECSRSIAVMHNIYGGVPIYPDRILFTEDLVNHIIHRICGIDFRLNGAEHFRENTYNAFSKVVEEGVDNILVKEGGLRYDTDELNNWDKGAYFAIAAEIGKKLLKEGLEPLEFLRFCVHVTLLAREFIWNGLSNAPNLAAIVIYESLMGYDMLLGGWDSLNFAAKQIKEAIDFREVMMIVATTPDISSTDTSDSELEQMSSGSDTSSDDELLNTDTDYKISSDESQDKPKLHASDSENTPALNTERCAVNLHLPNVATGNQHIEPIHDFRNSVREKREFVTQQEDVKDNMNVSEQLEAENLPEYFVIPNGRPLQHAHAYQIVVEGNSYSTNGETHEANMHKDSLYKY